MIYTTTLQKLRDHGACDRGYNLIAAHVGQDFTGVIPLATILDVNGLDDCIWAMRATDGGADLATAFAIICSVRIYTEPDYLMWAARWMDGTDRTETAARAARDAAGAAWDAAWAARAAWAATWAARDAARAAWDAWDATWAARAAWDATWAAGAARDAAGAARAARDAAGAARDAAGAARAAERAWQKTVLRQLVRNEYTGAA